MESDCQRQSAVVREWGYKSCTTARERSMQCCRFPPLAGEGPRSFVPFHRSSLLRETRCELPSVPKKILIVDDHSLVRLGLARLIADEPDLEVCGDARDVNEALEQVRVSQPDLAIVDVSSPSSPSLLKTYST